MIKRILLLIFVAISTCQADAQKQDKQITRRLDALITKSLDKISPGCVIFHWMQRIFIIVGVIGL